MISIRSENKCETLLRALRTSADLSPKEKGKLLYDLKKETGWSQIRISEVTEIPTSTISRNMRSYKRDVLDILPQETNEQGEPLVEVEVGSKFYVTPETKKKFNRIAIEKFGSKREAYKYAYEMIVQSFES